MRCRTNFASAGPNDCAAVGCALPACWLKPKCLKPAAAESVIEKIVGLYQLY